MSRFKTKFSITAIFICSMALCSCGSSSSSNEESDDTTAPSLTPAIQALVEYFGSEDNLYKPSADPKGAGAGNVVVLLAAKYTTQFDNCEATLSNGETSQLVCINDQPWTHVPYSCFGHGNRQTWRANFKCSEIAEVKVTCRAPGQEVVFQAPEGRTHELCSRFG